MGTAQCTTAQPGKIKAEQRAGEHTHMHHAQGPMERHITSHRNTAQHSMHAPMHAHCPMEHVAEVRLHVVHLHGQPKVCHHGLGPPGLMAYGLEQDVARLEVPVHYVQGV